MILSVECITPQEINLQLKAKLDSIMYKDQALRTLFKSIPKEEKKVILEEFGYTPADLERESWNIVARQDSLNLDLVSNIISRYGYPGRTLVSEPINEAAWYVIQLSNQIDKYFAIIEKPAARMKFP